jgi:hypothetical protein
VQSNSEEKNMKQLSQVLFWLGILSIPLSWAVWYFGADIEVGRQVLDKIADPSLRAAAKEAHAERWGIFVGLWPVTLLVLSYVLDRKSGGK